MDLGERVALLRGLAFFSHLPEPALAALGRALTLHRTPAGGLIFEEGSPGDTIFLLVEGEVGIDKAVEAGGVKPLALLGPGDVFGEMGLLDGAPRSARAVARTEVVCFGLGREDLERWLRADPPAAMGFFLELNHLLARRVRRVSEQVALLHDLSQLLLDLGEHEPAFLGQAVHRLLAHLEGEWSAAAYLGTPFGDELMPVGAEGPAAAGFPPPPVTGGAALPDGWLNPATFRLRLPGPGGALLAVLDLRSESPLGPRERRELETTLAAAGPLIGSALRHIRQEHEERLRARLEGHRASW